MIYFLLSLGLLATSSFCILLIWYAINAINKIKFMTEAIEDLNVDIEYFEKHLTHLYELDTYYGDETLKSLISHTKDLIAVFSEFKGDYKVFNGEIDENDLLEEENDPAETQNNG